MNLIRVRVKETGQVQEMLPDVARALVYGSRIAELVDPEDAKILRPSMPETASLEPRAEKAVAPAQQSRPKKPKARSAR